MAIPEAAVGAARNTAAVVGAHVAPLGRLIAGPIPTALEALIAASRRGEVLIKVRVRQPTFGIAERPRRRTTRRKRGWPWQQ